MHETVIEIMLGLIVVPWCVFVTSSIFMQRQELTLLKQMFTDFKDLCKYRHGDV